MVAMQVADENIIYSAGFNIKPQHLLLGAFSAVNQIKLFVYVEYLRCGVPVKNGGCRTAAQYCYFEFHTGVNSYYLSSFFSSFSISSIKIRSMPSSQVGTIESTLSSCDMVTRRDTASFNPQRMNEPDEFLHNRCPTNKLLKPDESANFT